MLRVEAIDVFYGHVQALRDVSLTVDDGQMVALLGANGAGKTTTLRAVSGMVPLTEGAISFDGRSLAGMTPEETARLGIAHIPEGRGIFPRMTVRQNIKMGAYVSRLASGALASRTAEVLEVFPALQGRLSQQAGTLSGGEQQMLAIARALISRPKLLMLDEPSHGLAPIIVQDVFRLLDGLRAGGMSLLIVEQYASLALATVDHAYVLDRGRVAMSGTSSKLRRNRERLAGAYLGS